MAQEPPSPPNWVAIAALVISLLTALKTFWTDWRTWRGKKAAKFEADYGTPIRTGLRAYEKAIFTLRAYTVASGKTLPELQKEVEVERAKWIEAADEVVRLLREADDTGTLIDHGWATRFEGHSSAAEELMLELTEPTVTTVDDLRQLAGRIQAELSVAVIEVRTALRDEAQSYDRIFSRK